MKNISLILNGVLIIAVGVLYYLQFKPESTPEAEQVEEVGMEESVEEPARIAYINSDTLMARYEFFKEIGTKLERQGNSIQATLQRRTREFEQGVLQYQKDAPMLTIGQSQQREQQLQAQQQEILALRENMAQKLMEDEANANNELFTRVSEYLEQYGNENNLQVVLTYARGSGVLFANDDLDITNDVIDGLNRAYEAEKNGGAVTAADSLQGK